MARRPVGRSEHFGRVLKSNTRCIKVTHSQRAVWLIVGIFILGAVLQAGARASEDSLPHFTCREPGNCFIAGQPAALDLVFPEGRQPLRGRLGIVDYENALLFDLTLPGDRQSALKGIPWRVEIGDTRLRLRAEELASGFYIAQWTAEGADTAAATLRFAVIPRREYFGPSPFAMDAAFSWFVTDKEDLTLACALLKAAGVDWVRDRFAWGHIQPEPGRWDWSRYDSPIRTQHEAGMRVYQVFHDTAPWAARTTEGSKRPGCYPPEDLNRLGDFLNGVVDRYRESVSAWEVWNEMDSGFFFAGSAEEYTALLKKAYRAIKESDPAANVLLGSICMAEGDQIVGDGVYPDREGPRFLEKILECGGGDYFDTYNFHCYGPVDGLLDRFQVDAEILHRFGQAHKPVWLTEMGLPSAEFTSSEVLDSERRQAEYLVKAYTLAASLGVEKVFFFIFPTFLEHGVSHWGIYNYAAETGWEPKPAYVALARMTHTLRAGDCRGRYEFSQGLRGVLFEVGGEDRLVVWSLKPEGSSLRMPKGVVEAGDILGRPLDWKPNEELLVTASPIYLRGNLGALLRKGQKVEPLVKRGPQTARPPESPFTVLLRCEPNRASPGDRVRLVAEIYNETGVRQEGSLRLALSSLTSAGEREVSFLVDPGRRFKTELEVEVDEAESMGESVQKVTVFQQGQITDQAQSYLEIIQPIRIPSARLEPALPGEALGLRIVLANDSQRLRSPRLTLDQPRRRGRSSDILFMHPFPEMLPGQSGDVLLPLPKEARLGEKAVLRGEGAEYAFFLDAPLVNILERKPRIDGRPEESSLAWWHIDHRRQCVQGSDLWNGPGDLSGEVAMGLFEDGLYLAGEVRDDARGASIGREQPWTGDAVELFFDFRRERLGAPVYEPGVFQFFLVAPSPLAPEGRIVLWQPEQKEIGQARYAFRMGRRGYRFELWLPLEVFGLQRLESSRIFGVDIVLDDRDGLEGRHKQMVWRGTGNNWRDPSKFAPVIVMSRND